MDINAIQEMYASPLQPLLPAAGLVIVCFFLAIIIILDKKIFDGLKSLKKHDPSATLCGTGVDHAIRKTKYTVALHVGGILYGSICILLFSFAPPWDTTVFLILTVGFVLIAYIGCCTFDVFWSALEIKLLLRSFQ